MTMAHGQSDRWEFLGKSGPLMALPQIHNILDIYVPAGVKKTFKVDTYRKAFAYVFEGQVPLQMPAHQRVCCWKKKSWAKK